MNIQAMHAEPSLADPPLRITLSGSGVLRGPNESVDVDTVLTMIPGRSCVITCTCEHQPPAFLTTLSDPEQSTVFEIEGEVDGREFWCEQLIETAWTWHFAGVERYWSIVIAPDLGQQIVFDHLVDPQMPLVRADVALMTYIGPGLDITVDGWRYQLATPFRASALSDWVKAWRSPVESASLLVQPDSPSSLGEVRARVDVFLRLLSLAQGDNISYHRYQVTASSGDASEVWDPRRRVVVPTLSNDMPIPIHTQAFLPVALQTYTSLPHDQRDLLDLAMGYHLAAKKDGVLHTAFLSEAVAWEMLVADRYGTDHELPTEVDNLKCRIQPVVSQWRQDYPEFSEHGMYTNRLYDNLRWKELREGITQLVADLGLDQVLPCDPRLLKTFRDSIVHTGDLPSDHQDHAEACRILLDLRDAGDLVFARLLYPDLPLDA